MKLMLNTRQAACPFTRVKVNLLRVLVTGIGYELNSAGKLINETSYVDGREDGSEKIWYPNGQTESVIEVKWNRPHGKFQHWYEDGKIKDKGVCELGYVVKRKEWDKNGNLINEYNIENDPESYKQLLRERKIFQRYGIS